MEYSQKYANVQKIGRWSRSKNLTKTSWRVLKKDPELIWLTVWGMFFAILGLFIGGLVALLGGMAAASGTEDWWRPHSAVLYVSTLVAMLLAGLSNAFFHGALVHGTLCRLLGGDPTVRSSMEGARMRFWLLLRWSIVSVIFAAVMHAIRRRAGFITRAFAWIAEAAWEVLSFLVLPIIIAEKKGAIGSIKRSAQMLKDTWGENLIGQFGIGIIGFVVSLPGVVVGGLIALAGNSAGSSSIVWLGVIVAVLWSVLVSLFFSALKSVYQAVLYNYAVKHEIPEGFDNLDLDSAFVTKENKTLI